MLLPSTSKLTEEICLHTGPAGIWNWNPLQDLVNLNLKPNLWVLHLHKKPEVTDER